MTTTRQLLPLFALLLIITHAPTRLQCNALAATPSSPPQSPILVIGATGGTGLRALEGLLDAGLSPPNIRVLSRNITKPFMVNLRQSGFGTVQADLDDNDMSQLEDAMAGCTGCYIHATATDSLGNEGEEDRAANLFKTLDNPLNSIQHVVYNSAVGEEGHGVKGIRQKHAVEEVFTKSNFCTRKQFTSLRANLFMEELWKKYTRPGILKGKFSFSVSSHRKIYLTSVRDMGRLAGACLLSSSSSSGSSASSGSESTKCRIVNVAGDYLSINEISQAFAKVQGSPCVHRKSRFLRLVARLFVRDLYSIMKFYETTTEETNIEELKGEFPGLLTSFEEFLHETDWSNPNLSYDDLMQRKI